MCFRSRLDGSAKVVLVGQEGAQDESLSHRSFTGGTEPACSTCCATSADPAFLSSGIGRFRRHGGRLDAAGQA
jgi:hypothetical protein